MFRALRARHALAGGGIAACVAVVTPAAAQDATWNLNGTGNWNTAANWTPATVPTGIATFGASNQTTVGFSPGTTNVATIQFNAGAPAYTFNLNLVGGADTLNITGTGIINNSSSTQNFFVQRIIFLPHVSLNFRNASTAGTATIDNFGGIAGLATTNFFDSSSAASATINNNLGDGTYFHNSSTAANATINNGTLGGTTGDTGFFDNSTAANATILNPENIGGVFFLGSSTAADAQITNRSSASNIHQVYPGSITAGVFFGQNSTAANATIINDGGNTVFWDSVSAANATFINSGASALTAFYNLLFAQSSSAGSANITNNADGVTLFQETSTAGNATIVNNNGGSTQFFQTTSAGNATITNNSGGQTVFGTNATANAATIINNAGGSVDISQLTAAGISIGTLSGAGNIFLGSHNLTLLGLGGSATIGGVIADGGINGGAGGSLTKNGTGVTTLSGNNTYTGPTTVNAGTLLVTGSIASSSALTVNNGGAVGGNGTLPTTILGAGAMLSPGTSIGTTTVNGNLTFNAGSTYVVEVSPTAADRTNVTGTANLAGTVQAVFLPGSYSANSYTILSAGARSGTFNAFTTTGLPSFLTASLNYTATDVLLVTLTSSIAQTITGTTPNQRAVAGALDTAFNSGQGLFTGFAGLTMGQVPAALDALSGEVHATTAGVLADESRTMRGAILGRLRQAPYVGGNGAMAALATGGPELAHAPDAMQAYAANFPVKAAPGVAAPSPEYTAWATAFGAWGKIDSDGNAAEAKRSLGGFVTGFDRRFGTWRLGAAAGYTASNIRVSARSSSADVDSYHIAGYAGGNAGPFNLRFGAAYAHHDIDTNRTAAFPGFSDQLRASYDGYTAQAFGEAGYAMSYGRFAVEPFAGLAAVATHTDAFTETGTAAAPLTGASERHTVIYSTLGIRAATSIVLAPDKVLVPRVSAAWQHAFDDVTPTTRMAFVATGAAFTVAGVPIARDSALIEAGADLNIGRNISLGLSYVGQLAADAQDHAVKGRGVWRF